MIDFSLEITDHSKKSTQLVYLFFFLLLFFFWITDRSCNIYEHMQWLSVHYTNSNEAPWLNHRTSQASERFSPDKRTPSISSISVFLWNSASVGWWNTATWCSSVDYMTGWYQCSFGRRSSEVWLSTDRLDHQRVGKSQEYSFSIRGPFDVGSKKQGFSERQSICITVLVYLVTWEHFCLAACFMVSDG